MRVNSEIRFFIEKDCIEGKAFFEVQDENSIIDMRVPYNLISISVNGWPVESIKVAAEYLSISLNILERRIHAEFVDYADTLPF